MNKKHFLPLSLAAAVLAVGVIGVGGGVGVGALYAGGTSETWVHYAKKDATATANGVREYWVKCGGNEYRFTAPEGVTPVEGGEHDTTGFAANDDRWIYSVNVDADVDMTQGTKSINLGAYAGGTISSMTIGGENVGTNPAELDLTAFAEATTHGEKALAVEMMKDGKAYYVNGVATLVTHYIASADDYKTYTVPTSGNVYGYFKQTANFNSQSSQPVWLGWSNLFCGTYNGNGYTITGKSTAGGLFSYVSGGTIKNVTVSDGWYGNYGNVGLLAKAIKSSVIENCTFTLAAGSSNTTGAAYKGWIVYGYCMSAQFKGCTFNCGTKDVFSLLGSGTNYAGITFSNSTWTVGQYSNIYYSNYSKTAVTSASGLTINGTFNEYSDYSTWTF